MPIESTNLVPDVDNSSPTQDTFRSAERKSNLRANIFLLECIVVLSIYVYGVYWHLESDFQAHLLTFFGVVYLLRLNVMARWLLKREMAMEELTFVILIWVPGILASYVLLANEVTSDIQLVSSLLLYLVGSYFNSYSEIQRKNWKAQPENKGRCYTEGLFSLSRNINYFGDSLLFTGWALACGSWWNAWAPILMSLTFWYHHIPDKEKYLEQRYAKDWPAYKQQTPHAFILFIC